ncbi:glycosyltransferase [Flavobacterium sangjuense]|uniref:Glycosyltransferase 2-like domain-containing protein n=1 Tax=Flavobacterium sangjuense TaxID=2518177 RepID=A0A4P7PU92_9FLAO|nr:glycosyltransferase [Flavobacterium sangjuense]QBZ97870.1 hypothetical protein GS03_01368 [Flavobacterium sangjuense]
MKFAAFIMTYERPQLILDTISKLLEQTLPPVKIVVIDNSETTLTQIRLEEFNSPIVVYHRVGYNSGPSGAAAIALKMLADEGYDWIYWGDDDDPPQHSRIFEQLLDLAQSLPYCGSVGCVGHFFDPKKGIINRVPNIQLQGKGHIEVDTIAGGMTKIVNGKMIREYDILPEKEFFFGFEDLDIDLKIQKAGFHLYVDKEIYLNGRIKSGKINLHVRKINKPTLQTLWREYYSIRNLMYIFWRNKLYSAFLRILVVKSLKMVFNFRYSFAIGCYTTKITLLAFAHFFQGKMGLRVKPLKK